MKKLLSLIAVSTIGVTGASELKPLFTSNITHGFKSNKQSNSTTKSEVNPFVKKISDISDINCLEITSDGTIWAGTEKFLYKSTDGTNFTKILEQKNGFYLKVDSDGTIWAGAGDGLYKSTDGTNFTKILDNISFIYTTKSAPNGTIYVGEYQGFYKIDLLNSFIKFNNPDYIGNKYNGFIYKTEQNIDIIEQYLHSAVLDGKTLTIPATNINLAVGKHELTLTVKEDYKQFVDLIGGNTNTGEIQLHFWIKTAIDDKEVSYQTNNNDTDLLVGLTSDLGNTNGSAIIQTKTKTDTGIHAATLRLMINSSIINLNIEKSYYVQGTVDEANNFTENSTKQKLETNTEITSDGTYHLHLVDMVGNIYDSYLELGVDNWKLKGQFNDNELNELSNKLNVTVDLTDPNQKQEALGWLQNYQSTITNVFNETVNTKGKGFNIITDDLTDGLKMFLDHVTYVDSSTQQGINQTKLDSLISAIANKKLQDGLVNLPNNLNVATDNVVNKSTLDSYSIWIKEYEKFVNSTKDQWINDAVALASRGFATAEEIQSIKGHIESLKFSDYLENITWTPNVNTLGYGMSNDFLQYVKLDKLDKDTIEWTNNNLPNINQTYELALKIAETDLNLHGYSIDTILNGKPLPKTKGEIDNFANGISFHDYLQTQANSKFHGWQLQMGLGIGLPLLLVAAGIGIIIRWRTDPRYNPLARARKDVRADKKAAKKGQ